MGLQNFDIDDMIKSYCKVIDMLEQNGYWSTKARDFLPLALANWSIRPVRIETSKQDQPIIKCNGMAWGSLVLSMCRVTHGLTEVDYIKPL